MLENLDLTRKLPKKRYKQLLEPLQIRLLMLQRCCHQAGIASVVVLDGWDASGKGRVVHKLTERLDPRAVDLQVLRPAPPWQRGLPWLWRFWRRLPSYGTMGVFLGSWHRRVIAARVEGGAGEAACEESYSHINAFTRALTADRYIVLKHFLHIERDEQRKRIEKLVSHPRTAWRVAEDDWRQNRRYDDYLAAIEEMLARTETAHAPWRLIAAHDLRWAKIKVLENCIAGLEDGLRHHGEGARLAEMEAAQAPAEDED